MTTLWDTTGTDVVKALAKARRAAGGVTSGLALTLVVAATERTVAEAEQAASVAAAAHPARLIIVVRREINGLDPRLDAEISVGDRLGPGEAVVMRMYGRLALHAESVVLPLLAPDVPVVTWWCGEAPPNIIAQDPLGVLADRRITDCSQSPDPIAALEQRAIDYAPGDTDLSWTRTTPWRAHLAGAFDVINEPVVGATIIGPPGDATGALLAGWLQSRLGLAPEMHIQDGPGVAEVSVELATGGRVCVGWHDKYTAVVRRPGLPDRLMPMRRRPTGERLAEELRHLDPDQPYAATLEAITGLTGLPQRSPKRVHQWHDPALTS
ncbi:MAG: glucose-6-phosphate dehydrogenase assembly protein OpcA [Corynebacteriales bacterium]|nr:glucose-6-phosphate dehydrogenase assembly protein OpcA [Mycobacteriales bacterium]